MKLFQDFTPAQLGSVGVQRSEDGWWAPTRCRWSSSWCPSAGQLGCHWWPADCWWYIPVWNGVDRSWEKKHWNRKKTKNKNTKAQMQRPARIASCQPSPQFSDFPRLRRRDAAFRPGLAGSEIVGRSQVHLHRKCRGCKKCWETCHYGTWVLPMVFWPLEDSIYLTCSRCSSELHNMNILGDWFPEMACQKQIDKNREIDVT